MRETIQRNFLGMIGLAAALLLVTIRWFFPERSMDELGASAIWDNGFAIGLLSFTLMTAGSIGRKITKKINPPDQINLEQTIFSLSIGLGVIAYGVFALGQAGLLKPGVFIIGFVI